MLNRCLPVMLAGAFILPLTSQAHARVAVPNQAPSGGMAAVELFATVTGKWVLDPRKCRDIREDRRDERVAQNRRDRRKNRRDQRVADCPASAYIFVVDPGQGPQHPVRVSRGPVERKHRGKTMFINGDTIGPDGMPVVSERRSGGTVTQLPTPTFPYQPVQPQQPVQPFQPYQPTTLPEQPYLPPVQTYQPQQPGQQYQPYQPYQPPVQQVQPTQTQPAAQPDTYRIINGQFVFD